MGSPEERIHMLFEAYMMLVESEHARGIGYPSSHLRWPKGRVRRHFTNLSRSWRLKEGRRENIQVVSMDLSGTFIAGYFKHFSHASLVFDKFHIVKLLNKALDDTRKAKKNDKKLLKGNRSMFLWRKANLIERTSWRS